MSDKTTVLVFCKADIIIPSVCMDYLQLWSPVKLHKISTSTNFAIGTASLDIWHLSQTGMR